MSKVKNLFWFDGDSKDFTVDNNTVMSFNLTYRNMLIGILCYYDGQWHFSYSEEFKHQDRILPLINFPDKHILYESNQLWPFFASRIPSSAQRQIKDGKNQDLFQLLRKYGRNVVANPYVLTPTAVL